LSPHWTNEEISMRIRLRLIFLIAGAAFLAAAGAVPVAAQTPEVFRDEKVRVTKVVLAPGAQQPLQLEHASVVVYLEGQSKDREFADGTRQEEQIRRGLAEEEPAGKGVLTNSGLTPLVFVRVEFLTGGSDAMWGASGLAPNYRVLLEDRYSRTYEIKMPAHGTEPEHTHHDRVVVCLSGAELVHTLPDGSRQPSTLKTGEIGWRVAQTHRGENVGNTDLWVIAIEPK
jgi:quercetin dioxygenase-like cupin family protein